MERCEGALSGGAVREVNKAVAWVSSGHGVYGDVDILVGSEVVFHERVFDFGRLDIVEQVAQVDAPIPRGVQQAGQTPF